MGGRHSAALLSSMALSLRAESVWWCVGGFWFFFLGFFLGGTNPVLHLCQCGHVDLLELLGGGELASR